MSRLYLGDVSGAFNFGPPLDHVITVKEFTQRMIIAWSGGAISTGWSTKDPPESSHLCLESSKAHFTLKWKHLLSINHAIQRTVDWYKEYYNGTPAFDITRQQTEAYLHLYSQVP